MSVDLNDKNLDADFFDYSFRVIYEEGILAHSLDSYGQLEKITILNKMLRYFSDLEQYEKCAYIKEILTFLTTPDA